MNQQVRPVDSTLLYRGVLLAMKDHGLDVSGVTHYPKQCPSLMPVGPQLGHLCFGDDEELFPVGVPVFGGRVGVTQANGTRWVVFNETEPYWTGPVLLLHEWAKPSREWRLLHFLEAASLLVMNPGLGAVRYSSPNATSSVAEAFIYEGRIYVACGTTPRGHHAAYTKVPRNASVHESR